MEKRDYMTFWQSVIFILFEKYTKIKVWPWYFIDDFGRAR